MNDEFFFETSSNRRKGFPSETKLSAGFRLVRGDMVCRGKELFEKSGRNDFVHAGQTAGFKGFRMQSGDYGAAQRTTYKRWQARGTETVPVYFSD